MSNALSDVCFFEKHPEVGILYIVQIYTNKWVITINGVLILVQKRRRTYLVNAV